MFTTDTSIHNYYPIRMNWSGFQPQFNLQSRTESNNSEDIKSSCGTICKHKHKLKSHSEDKGCSPIFTNPRGRPKKTTFRFTDVDQKHAVLHQIEMTTFKLKRIFEQMQLYQSQTILMLGTQKMNLNKVKDLLLKYQLPEIVELVRESYNPPTVDSSLVYMAEYYLFELRKHLKEFPYSHLVVFFYNRIKIYNSYLQSNELNPFIEQPQYINKSYSQQIEYFFNRASGSMKSQKMMPWSDSKEVTRVIAEGFINWMKAKEFIS